jgi:hypothetical protein
VRINGGLDHPIFNSTDILNIINGYKGLSAPTSAWMIRLFRAPSLEEEILMHAHYAGPLDQLEALAKKAHNRKEKHLPNTLIKAAVQALRVGDVSLRDDNNIVLYEGMTEKLLQLCSDLFPELFQKKLFPRFQEQARHAAPQENKEQKEDKERRFQAKIENIFNANRDNNAEAANAIQAFKNWANELSVADKILLIYLARIELANKGETLPGGLYGELGDRFCTEVIWDALQKNLPSRQQQILACGVNYVFSSTLGIRKLVRFIDFESASFIAKHGFFYNEFGGVWAVGRSAMAEWHFFKTYYEQLHQRPDFMPQQRSIRRPAHNSA